MIERSRLDPQPIPRRDFLGLSAMFSAFAALLWPCIPFVAIGHGLVYLLTLAYRRAVYATRKDR